MRVRLGLRKTRKRGPGANYETAQAATWCIALFTKELQNFGMFSLKYLSKIYPFSTPAGFSPKLLAQIQQFSPYIFLIYQDLLLDEGGQAIND